MSLIVLLNKKIARLDVVFNNDVVYVKQIAVNNHNCVILFFLFILLDSLIFFKLCSHFTALSMIITIRLTLSLSDFLILRWKLFKLNLCYIQYYALYVLKLV